MKKVIILSALVMAGLCSCNNSCKNGCSDKDSTDVVCGDSCTAKLLEGYESSEGCGVKAWIENGKVMWQLVNANEWVKLTDDTEFIRCGDDPWDVELTEKAVGVKIARHDEEYMQQVSLFIISESGHVYTLQLNEAVACVTMEAGKLPYAEKVIGFECKKEGADYVVSTKQSDGGSVDIKLYGYHGEEGVRSCEILVGDAAYMLNMDASWGCRLNDNKGNTYSGNFVAVGDEAPNKWALTFYEIINYTEDGTHHKPIKPVTVYMEWNDEDETIKLGENPFDIPTDKALPAEIIPLYD